MAIPVANGRPSCASLHIPYRSKRQGQVGFWVTQTQLAIGKTTAYTYIQRFRYKGSIDKLINVPGGNFFDLQ